MKVALVHDFLVQLGGAERVLDRIAGIFPDAPIYTLVYDEQRTEKRYARKIVKTSFLQKFPGGAKHYKWYLPLMPAAIEHMDFTGYDLVFSDASAFAKGAITAARARHISYCHTPTRYLWQDRDSYIASLRYPVFIKMLLPAILSRLQSWDYKAAQRPAAMIANSREVAGRIAKFYHRRSEVIYPPVDSDFFCPGSGSTEDYFLVASRLEPYKRLDLVVRAFSEMNLPLKVAGAGSELENLMSIAGKNVEFLGRVSDSELRELYRHARAYVFPALEDAGIMVLESLACGTPVIAYGAGGALELMEEGKHGLFFYEQTVASLAEAVRRFGDFRPQKEILVLHAREFSNDKFKQKIIRFIENCV